MDLGDNSKQFNGLLGNRFVLACLALALVLAAYFVFVWLSPAPVLQRSLTSVPLNISRPLNSLGPGATITASNFFSYLEGTRIYFACKPSERDECVRNFPSRGIIQVPYGFFVDMGEISQNFGSVCGGAKLEESLVNLIHITRSAGGVYSIDCAQGHAYSQVVLNIADNVSFFNGVFSKCTSAVAREADLILAKKFNETSSRDRLLLPASFAFRVPSEGDAEYYIAAMLCRTIPAPKAAFQGWFEQGDSYGFYKHPDHSGENAYAFTSVLLYPPKNNSKVNFTRTNYLPLQWPFWKLWVEERQAK